MSLIKLIFFLFEIFGNLWNISTATQEHCIPSRDSWNETEIYYVIQLGESSPELIKAVAGDVACTQQALWFGHAFLGPYLPFL